MSPSPRVAWLHRAVVTVLIAGALLSGCAKETAPAPPPGTPRFPAFLFPEPPQALAAHPAVTRHQAGWAWLQAGEFRAAERQFEAAIKESGSAFYPADAGLGYVALAQNDHKEAVEHFDRAVAADPAYVPALVGRGEAHLALGHSDQALESFQAALAADPQLAAVRSRVEVLRFRGLQDDVAVARKAAEGGRFDEARAGYQQAIAASPESPFLYRELAAVERSAGNLEAALQHAEKATALDPADARALILAADIHEARGDYPKALDALTAAVALEPGEALDDRIEGLRERAAFAAMPEEYRNIGTAPTVTRAQLAAVLGVRLDELLKRTRRRTAVVVTDTRGSWAAPWILAVTRAGLMEVYPNHTFQPNALVRRGELASAASRALSLLAAENPRIGAQWRNGKPRFADLGPGHLSYPAVSLVITAGVMATAEDGSFQLSRPVTGAETLSAVQKLEELSEKPPR